jgi:hypothetical protein
MPTAVVANATISGKFKVLANESADCADARPESV